MYAIGAIEIVAGLLVAVKPRYGALTLARLAFEYDPPLRRR